MSAREVCAPLSISSWIRPAMTQAMPAKAMPKPMRRSAVGSQPIFRNAGYRTMLLNGIISMISNGLSACI